MSTAYSCNFELQRLNGEIWLYTSGKRRQHHLSLEEKVEVIKKCNLGSSVQTVSKEFNCGVIQIYTLLKSKESIMAMYGSNASKSSLKCRSSEYSEINEKLYEWYLLACSKNIYPDGPQLRQKLERSLNVLESWILKHPMDGLTNRRSDITLEE